MKISIRMIALACMTLAFGTSLAQEHYTEGPVWEINMYQIEPGQGDAYMKWLRTYAARNNGEAKKQGLILDYKFGSSGNRVGTFGARTRL